MDAVLRYYLSSRMVGLHVPHCELSGGRSCYKESLWRLHIGHAGAFGPVGWRLLYSVTAAVAPDSGSERGIVHIISETPLRRQGQPQRFLPRIPNAGTLAGKRLTVKYVMVKLFLAPHFLPRPCDTPPRLGKDVGRVARFVAQLAPRMFATTRMGRTSPLFLSIPQHKQYHRP